MIDPAHAHDGRSATAPALLGTVIDHETTVLVEPGLPSHVETAVMSLRSDMRKVTGHEPRRVGATQPNQVRIRADVTLPDECYRVDVGQDAVTVWGHGLGVVFGIYHLSTHHLGIDPYAAWTSVEPSRTERIQLDVSSFVSAPHPVRHRCWFINDEDCLRGMSGDGEIALDTWQLIFETMLRTGWNTVIPGTGLRPDAPQLDLADEMGLWVAQHHSEPLGARLYSEEYPSGDPPPDPFEDPERYQALYRAAIDEGSRRRVIWTLGLRGQGDEPFPSEHDDAAEQGALLSAAIAAQKRLVEDQVGPGQRFVHYLYSESAQLYRSGHLTLDADVLPVWSDNGFGAMRVRRNWGAEPNVSALPSAETAGRPIGAYYHVSFHDLQASGLLVPHAHPADVVQALQALTEHAQLDFFVLNVGNIRPHLCSIDLVADLLRSTEAPATFGELAQDHLRRWTARYFSNAARDVSSLILDYYDAAFRFGEHHDERAGDEFYHHTLRRLTAAAIKGDRMAPHLAFIREASQMVDRDALTILLPEAQRAAERYEALDAACAEVYPSPADPQRPFFWQSVWLPIRFMNLSATSFVYAAGGLVDFLDGDYESTFRKYSRASTLLQQLWTDVTSTATGRWRDFYRGEWLVDIRETQRVVRTMQGLAFILGDTHHREVSEWTVKAFDLGDSLLSPNRQASCDHDRLAWALDRFHAGEPCSVEDLA